MPVPGTYRYRDLFQLLPPPDDAPLPPASLGDYPCVIEFAFTPRKMARIDPAGYERPKWVVDNEIASQTLREILLLLTLITSRRLFLFQGSFRQAWFVSLGSKGKKRELAESEWGQEMYYCGEFDQNLKGFSSPPQELIGQVDPNLYFNKIIILNEVLDFPKNVTAILDCYYTLPDEAKRVFLSSCSLFDQAIRLWSEHPSLSFAAFVSALETLITYEHRNVGIEKCETCGQEIFKVGEKFRDFFSAYGSPSPEFKSYANKIYKYRSKILHRGKLFLGEIEPRNIGSVGDMKDVELRRNIVLNCRICIVNWLTRTAGHNV